MNSMGGSIGIALYGTIMGNSLKSQFASLDPAVMVCFRFYLSRNAYPPPNQ